MPLGNLLYYELGYPDESYVLCSFLSETTIFNFAFWWAAMVSYFIHAMRSRNHSNISSADVRVVVIGYVEEGQYLNLVQFLGNICTLHAGPSDH